MSIKFKLNSCDFESEAIEWCVRVRAGKNRNIAVKQNLALEDIVGNDRQTLTAFVPGISGVALRERPIYPPQLQKTAGHGDANIYLRNVLLYLERDYPDLWAQFNAEFSEIYPGYRFSIVSNVDTDEFIDVEVEYPTVVNGKSCNATHKLEELGTGAIQVAQILAYYFYYHPNLLLLDEPEVHLHPELQRKLIRTLADISTDRIDTQIIVSSHSTHMLDALLQGQYQEYSDIDRDSRNGVKLDSALWLSSTDAFKDHNVIELDSVNAFDFVKSLDACDIVGKPRFVFYTEDEDTKFLKMLLKANNFDVDLGAVISYRGCSNLSMVKIMDSLYVKNGVYPKETPVFVWRDSDCVPRNIYVKKWQKECDKFNGCLVTSYIGSAIEGEFVRAASNAGINIDQRLSDSSIALISQGGAALQRAVDQLSGWDFKLASQLTRLREQEGLLGVCCAKSLYKALKGVLSPEDLEKLEEPDPKDLERSDLIWLADQVAANKSRAEIHKSWREQALGFEEPQAETKRLKKILEESSE